MDPVKDGFFESAADLGVCNLHLVSGEDIIGRVTKKIDPVTTGESYLVGKPVMPNVGMSKDPETSQPRFAVGLLPLRPYLGGLPEVELPTAYVMYIVKVNAQMERMYLEFTTGIALAAASDLPKVSL